MKFLLKTTRLLVIFFALNSCAQGKKPLPYNEVTAFVHVNLITMQDSVPLMNQTVIIENKTIVKIGPSSQIEIPQNAIVIDGKNQKYLTPGLVDTHVHINRPKSKEWMADFVKYGVTTVFSLKGNRKTLSMREAVKNGTLFGPDIYTAGPFVGKNKKFEKITQEDMEEEVRSQKKAGYDMIKIHGNMTLDVYKHLMDFSRKEGMHVMGHIPRNLTFKDALDVQQLSLAHTEEMIYTQFADLNIDDVPLFAERAGKLDMWLMPGVMTFDRLSISWAKPSVMDAVMELPETERLHPYIKKLYKQDWYGDRDAESRAYFQDANAFYKPLTKQMYDAGVRLLLGTDAPMPNVAPGISVHEEIDALLAMGITPFEVLKIGTANAGEYVATHLNKTDKFGQITEGYRANVLLLSSNPLEDMCILRTPEGVLKGGAWYDSEVLRDMTTW